MSSPDRFSDNRYKNWLKCGLALIVMKEDLHQYMDNQVQTLHNYLISKVSPSICGASVTIHCGVCTWQNIKYDRHKKLWHMNCSKNICNVWLQEIIAVHKTPDNPKINWRNCDISQWPSDPYQVAKAFMPNGQANVTKLPEDLDPPAVLSLLYYCTFLCKNVSNTQILHDLIEVRNLLFHSGNFFVEDSEKDTWINNMLQLLQDLKLNGTEIDKIKREDLDINFRKTEIRVFEALVSTLNSDFKTMYAALNIKIISLEDCQKEQEEKMGKVQVCCSESTVKVVTMEAKMESFEKFTQDFIPVKTFFDNNSDILDHDLINNNTKTMSKLQDCFEILKTKLENTNAELTSIKSRVEGVEDLDRKVSDYRIDLEEIVRKLEMLSGEFVKIQPVIDKWNRNKIAEEKNMKSTDQTLGDQEQRSFQQDGMPAAWTFTKEEIDRAWVPMEGVLVEDLAPSYILSSLNFLSDNERQVICQMESRGEMVKVVLCRVKEQLPDAFCILLNTLKEKGPEQLAEKLVKIIKGTCILNYAPKSNMSSLTMKLNVKKMDGTIVSETENEIARSIIRVSSVFSKDLQLMVTDVTVGSVIIHLQPLSEHAQARLAFFCRHGGIKDLVINLLRKKDIYASLPIGEVWIEVEICRHEEDVVSKDADEPWRDFASESFEVVSTNHMIKENLRLQYGRLLDEIEPLHLKKTFTDKGILDECFLNLRDLERRRERAAYFLDKLLATGSDEALITLVDALKDSGRENLATNLVAKRTPYLNDTDDIDESLIQVVKASQKHAEGSILWSCCLKITVENDGMPAAWTFRKEEIDRAWVPMEGVLVEDLAPSYILSSLTFLSDNERQAICQMESRGEMVKVVLCRVKEQLPDAFCILLNTLKEKGPEQLAEKLVKIIKGTCIVNYAPKSNLSSFIMKLNVKEMDGTKLSKTEKEIARSIKRVSSVFSEDLQLMVTNVVVVGSVIIHLQSLSEHAQARLAFFCNHSGIKDLVINLLRKKDIYASLPVGEVWIEVEVCRHEEDVVSEDANEPWRDFASESFEVVSTNHMIKENLRLQYGRLLDEIEPLHLKKTFTDKGILDECFLKLRDLERRRERAAYFLDKLLATGSDEALITLVDALKESGRENLATNLVAKRTLYLNDTDDIDESLIQVVKASQRHAEGSILWSCCLKVTVENNDDGKEQGMRHPTKEGRH